MNVEEECRLVTNYCEDVQDSAGALTHGVKELLSVLTESKVDPEVSEEELKLIEEVTHQALLVMLYRIRQKTALTLEKIEG